MQQFLGTQNRSYELLDISIHNYMYMLCFLDYLVWNCNMLLLTAHTIAVDNLRPLYIWSPSNCSCPVPTFS